LIAKRQCISVPKTMYWLFYCTATFYFKPNEKLLELFFANSCSTFAGVALYESTKFVTSLFELADGM